MLILIGRCLRLRIQTMRCANQQATAGKDNFGHCFAIIRNIDSSRTLPFGTPEEVAQETTEAIDIAAPGGGYVLASDHSLQEGISVENILEMHRAGTEYGGAFYRD